MVDPERFAGVPDISIDYAVMEHTTRAAVVPVAFSLYLISNNSLNPLQVASAGNFTITFSHFVTGRSTVTKSNEVAPTCRAIFNILSVDMGDSDSMVPRSGSTLTGTFFSLRNADKSVAKP